MVVVVASTTFYLDFLLALAAEVLAECRGGAGGGGSCIGGGGCVDDKFYAESLLMRFWIFVEV